MFAIKGEVWVPLFIAYAKDTVGLNPPPPPTAIGNLYTFMLKFLNAFTKAGAPVAQWVKRWPTDLADRVRSSFEVKSSQP